MAAATVGALVEASDAEAALAAGSWGDALALRLEGPGDPELATLAFEDQVAGVDRLRARALAFPAHVLADAADLRAPTGAHPLLIAVHVARLGGRPADPRAAEEHEEAILGLVGAAGPPVRPHDDPDPARRVARRILQRLDGMGKWGGYHTEFAHLARGFAGNDRAPGRGGRRGAARRGPAGREAERRPAPRLPQPAAGRRRPRAHRARRAPRRPPAALTGASGSAAHVVGLRA